MLTSQAVVKNPILSPLKAEEEVLDMALNHGTFCSEKCIEVLERFNTVDSVRFFPSVNNHELKAAIARDAGVSPENVMPANGSGPLLKLCLPFMIERKIKSSLPRMARHLLSRTGYPIYTPRLTYSKVPASAARVKLYYEMLPLGPENGFKLDIEHLERQLSRRDGMVYLANPNNPTGDVLITRSQLEPLLARFPHSIFAIDEAYAQYISPKEHGYLGELVTRYPNLVVIRSFSFAYGLAAARLGYILADASWIRDFEAKTTPHQVNSISAAMAIAALEDHEHLERVRRQMQEQRSFFYEGIGHIHGLEAFPSRTNFILCRTSGPKNGKQIYEELREKGVVVKIFEALSGERYDEYFRITVGFPEENQFLMRCLNEVFAR